MSNKQAKVNVDINKDVNKEVDSSQFEPSAKANATTALRGGNRVTFL